MLDSCKNISEKFLSRFVTRLRFYAPKNKMKERNYVVAYTGAEFNLSFHSKLIFHN